MASSPSKCQISSRCAAIRQTSCLAPEVSAQKALAALLRTYATLEDALTDSRFPLQADELRLYRRIAAMDPTAPLPSLNDQTPTWGEAAALARKWELNRLADRFEELAPVGA